MDIRLLMLVLVAMVTTVASQRSSEGFDVDERTRNRTEDELYPRSQSFMGCGECHCPEKPSCPPGVSLVQDGCGCCKICARQLEEQCDVRMVCDYHKGLYCDQDTRTCKASPGRPCYVRGIWYVNGQTFQPSCRATCSCIDGDLGCVPICHTPRTSPASLSCTHPRLIRRKGRCCGEWICPKGGKLGKNMLPFENELKGPQHHKVIFRGSCMVQTTPWSPCSKTCGFGISDRVTNDNRNCKLVKESRLCNIRSCSMQPTTNQSSKKRSCKKTIRHSNKKRVKFSLSGCLSADTYRPKYCGLCGNQCCEPKISKTVPVRFMCEEQGNSTSSFTRNMMMIKKCSCHECVHDNSIFSASFTGLGSDFSRLT